MMIREDKIAEDAKAQAAQSYDPVPASSRLPIPGDFAPQAKSRERNAVSATHTLS